MAIGASKHFEAPGLILAAKRLHNERLVTIFESFLEHRACIIRVVIQGIVFIWSWAWLYGPQKVLVKDAVTVFPATIALLAFAFIWMVLVRRRIIPETNWLDAAGFVIDLLFIGIQIYLAFHLLISLNAFLPFIVIAAVARYGKVAAKPMVAATSAILLFTAPDGYWLSRPAYFVYALGLTVALPLLVSRMVTAMQDIAFQALSSRDAQSRFISAMSHELRTPLNAIINCAQLIDSDAQRKEQNDLINAVSINAKALQHRLNEVLDVASIDGGRLNLNCKPLHMLNVMNTVQAVCANVASAKGVTLKFALDSVETPYLVGDEGRIEQVITNLVANAIKFTPSGGDVELFISATRSGDRWKVSVIVTDTGVGVPDEKKASIFAPFEQLSTGSTRTHGGVGLGLYIALSVSNAMGGKIDIRDNPGGGCIFIWTFDAAAAAGDYRARDLLETLGRHRAEVRPLHCLVFEDMDMNRLVIANLLTRAGHKVTFHVDGYDALERIRAADPDIVFLDLHMPGRSGWDALRERASIGLTSPPIVVLTADTRSESIRDAKAIGIEDYLAKPINAIELLAVIRRHADQL